MLITTEFVMSWNKMSCYALINCHRTLTFLLNKKCSISLIPEISSEDILPVIWLLLNEYFEQAVVFCHAQNYLKTLHVCLRNSDGQFSDAALQEMPMTRGQNVDGKQN